MRTKKLLSLLLTLALLLTLLPLAAAPALATAPETDANGYYQIGTDAELKWFRDQVNAGNTGICAKLTADIDLGGEAWEPIGVKKGSTENAYTGKFDGGGHTVSGLNVNINSGNLNYTGFFGFAWNAEIKNLTVAGSIVSRSYSTVIAGGIVGYAQHCTITDCVNACTVTAGSSNSTSATCEAVAGGIAGTAWGGTVERCGNVGTISVATGRAKVGGVAGNGLNNRTNDPSHPRANVRDCFSTGTVTVTAAADDAAYVGGIVGYLDSSDCSRCWATGTISVTGGSPRCCGGVVGYIFSDGSAADSYYLRSIADHPVGSSNNEWGAWTREQFAADGAAATLNHNDASTAWKKGSCMPTLACADRDLWVGNTRVNLACADNVLGDGEATHKAVYNMAANTLTLTNFTFTGEGHKIAATGASIWYQELRPLTVVLAGTNSVKNTSDSNSSYGVYDAGGSGLTFTGTGRLDAEGGPAARFSAGIYSDGGEADFTGGTVTATGGAVEGGNTVCRSFGVYAGSVSVDGGTLNAIGGTATRSDPSTTASVNSNGVFASNGVSVISGTLNATGGAADSYSHGVNSLGGISISGGEVYAVGGTAENGTSAGIWAAAGNGDPAVSIKNSAVVIAEGGSADEKSAACYGVYGANSGQGDGVKLENSADLTARGFLGDKSYGVYGDSAGTAVGIGGASTHVYAVGGDTGTSLHSVSAGIYGSGGSAGIHMTGGNVTAWGGDASKSIGGISTGIGSNKGGWGVYVQGGKAEAFGGPVDTSGGYSVGIFVNTNGFSIGVGVSGGAEVTARGSSPASTSCGIFSEMSNSSGNCDFAVRIADSAKVTAIGAPDAGSANCSSYGIKARSANGGIGVSVVPGGQAGQRPTVVAAAGAAPGGNSWGIHGKSVTGAGVYIVDGDVTATGSASGGTYGCSYGIRGESSLDCGIVVGGVANGLPCGPKVTAESGACAATIVGTSTGILGSTREGVAAVVIACKADVYAVGGDTGASIGIDGQSAQGQRKGPGVLITDEAAVKAIGGLADQSGETSNGIRGTSAGDVAVRIAGRATVTAIGPATAGNGRGINGAITVIEDQVCSVEAVGGGDSGVGIYSCTNAVAGLAWADADAAGDSEPIPVSDDAQNLTSYKVVCFPAHSLSYALEGEDTIKATCTSTYCDLEGRTATLRIVPPADLTEDGKAKAATLERSADVFGSPAVVYWQGDQALAGAPSTPGDYAAYVTVADCTAVVRFTIKQPSLIYYGGGSSTPAAKPAVQTFESPMTFDGGTVAVSPEKAKEGDAVALAATPDEGNRLWSLTAEREDGKPLMLTSSALGEASFTMPGCKVAVNAVFLPADAAPPVVLSPQKITVNGVEATVEAYNIGGTNFFRLRDLAALLKGTPSQFDVDYDADNNAVTVTKGAAYAGEVRTEFEDMSDTAVASPQTVYVDGAAVALTAYNIGGYNFFGLRELASIFGYAVGYDADTNTAIIESK